MSRRQTITSLVGSLLALMIVLLLLLDDARDFLLMGTFTLCLGLVCWGLSYVVQGRHRREILRHLTDAERNALNSMAADYGRRLGFSGGAIAGVAVFAFVALTDKFPSAFVALTIGGLVGVATIPFGARHRKQMKEFLAKTEYAQRT